MQKKLWAIGLALVLGGGFGISALAQTKPNVLVAERLSAMRLQQKYMVPMFLMATGKTPYDANIVARNSGYIEALSVMAWDGFTEDTKGEKSRALPEIYSNASGFKTAQDGFRGAATKLTAASKAGNEASTKTAITETLNSCNGCHKQFRGPAL